MKKIILISCSLFLLNLIASAQETKSSIGITVGPNFAVGNFAKKQFNDEAGLAKTGFFAEVDYGYRFSKSVGLAMALKGTTHGIDASGYQVPSGVGASSKIETTSWKTGSILGGLFQSFPLSADGKLTFELRELAGVQFTSSPEMKIIVTVPGMGSFNGEQVSYNATSFAFALGAGLKYNLNQHLGLKLFADYASSHPSFDEVATGTATTTESSSQQVQNIGLGVGIRIGF